MEFKGGADPQVLKSYSVIQCYISIGFYQPVSEHVSWICDTPCLKWNFKCLMEKNMHTGGYYALMNISKRVKHQRRRN